MLFFGGFCHLHHLVGRVGVCSFFFAQYTPGTSVASVGLTDDLGMRSVGTAAWIMLTAQRLSAGEGMRKRNETQWCLPLSRTSPFFPLYSVNKSTKSESNTFELITAIEVNKPEGRVLKKMRYSLSDLLTIILLFNVGSLSGTAY